MAEDRFKKLYEYMKENEELYDIDSELIGDWEVDSKRFIKAQIDLEEMVNYMDLEEDDDE